MRSRDLNSKLAAAVKRRRDELKLSREELAELMGAPLDVVTDLEESHDSQYVPTKTLRMLLSIALKVSEAEFFKSLTSDDSDVSDASKVSDVSDVSNVSNVSDVSDASDASKASNALKETEQSSPKPLFLPPMFSRTRSAEPKISTPDDDNQLVPHFGLPALPADPSRPLPRKTRAFTSDQTKDQVKPKQKSPFIPRHTVQKTHPIQLSVCESECASVSIGPSSSLAPVPDLNVVVTSPTNSNIRKNALLSSVATVQSHVPLIPPGLSAGQSQKETGIFQINMAPDPVAFQKINESFGKNVPGLTLNTTKVTCRKKKD